MRNFWGGNEGTRQSDGRILVGGVALSDTLSTNLVVNNVALPAPATALKNRKWVFILNADDTDFVYIGGATVSTTNGFTLYPHQAAFIPISDDAAVYVISTGAAVNADVRVLEGA